RGCSRSWLCGVTFRSGGMKNRTWSTSAATRSFRAFGAAGEAERAAEGRLRHSTTRGSRRTIGEEVSDCGNYTGTTSSTPCSGPSTELADPLLRHHRGHAYPGRAGRDDDLVADSRRVRVRRLAV